MSDLEKSAAQRRIEQQLHASELLRRDRQANPSPKAAKPPPPTFH